MQKTPYILVTNDDGVYAPGIKHLWKFLSSFAKVVVVAPASEQSAVGLSITVRHPLHIERISWHLTEEVEVWAINGTPADCVKLALSVILPETPQLIVSGINRGGNAGCNVLYSGTVAGVVEGVMHNIPGIAFSAADFVNPHFEAIEHYVRPLVNYALEHPFPSGTFLNVNFPKRSTQGIKGLLLAKQGKEYWKENPEQRAHPTEGNFYYWLGAKLTEPQEDPSSDVALLRQGYATAVPIQVANLTNEQFLQERNESFTQFFNDLSTG